MEPSLQNAVDYLKSKGIEVAPHKSTFQLNMEMATMLLTVLMSEVDYLRNRIEILEGGNADE
ncbi:hypothetical protein D3P07_00750 [Paenibacillus sp. 1011MAR3C5]|uniref:hypothetical protein n=1 Tax=Paenibacillus sp. 1011MAR3C5 TaxID=1675787 RepID=UPI000E6BEA9B|nr:hypothetical protein [Paenibacillus sp. 1011MAR3C5]RJE90669.1 hypothetical protein D3P07_00750 [Paenibacillus sp. 1011MAR3C5]